MTKLSIFRHAESVYENKIYAGNVDIPLSSKGIKQAMDLSAVVRALDPDIVYTSKLIRTMETALIMLTDVEKTVTRICPNELDSVIMNKNFLPIIEFNALNERNYGELQNKSKEQVLELYSLDMIQRWRRGFHVAPPGGESLCDVVERVQEFILSNVFPYISDYNILMVAHQNTVRAIYYLLMKQTPKEIEMIEFSNCEGIQFDFENGKVIAFNTIKR